ncbi:MAG: GDSL-like lipase/acylhydrolase family protein [Myxococcaceae bacterium]|nr:GDSL-like lipase/acylhydrolase family protein [Myxococcaceae bacterium]
MLRAQAWTSSGLRGLVLCSALAFCSCGDEPGTAPSAEPASSGTSEPVLEVEPQPERVSALDASTRMAADATAAPPVEAGWLEEADAGSTAPGAVLYELDGGPGADSEGAIEADAAAPEPEGVSAAWETDAIEPEPQVEPHWVTTWGTAIVSEGLSALFRSFARATLRQVVHTSVAGERVRVRLSNHFGRGALYIGGAHVALQSSGSSIIADTDRTLTFRGKRSVVVPRGQTVTSDPVALSLPALSDLTVSLYLSERTLVQNSHRNALQTSYLSAPGNFAGAVDLPTGSAITSWFYLEGVEVETRSRAGTVVTLGDSITDGFGSSLDADKRWPDELARRLSALGTQLGVANEGYSGNQILAHGAGESAVARFDRDVLGNAGVTHVIVAEGINDIGLSHATGEQVIEGLKQLIDKAHAAGLLVSGGTICPFEGSFFYSEQGELARTAVNEWIRGSGAFDGIVDFDQALRDLDVPTRLLPAYDSGDKLHPSDLGYEVMGQAVGLMLLK